MVTGTGLWQDELRAVRGWGGARASGASAWDGVRVTTHVAAVGVRLRKRSTQRRAARIFFLKDREIDTDDSHAYAVSTKAVTLIL